MRPEDCQINKNVGLVEIHIKKRIIITKPTFILQNIKTFITLLNLLILGWVRAKKFFCFFV